MSKKFLGNSKKFLRNSKKFLGISKKFLRHSQEFLRNSHKFLRNSKRFLRIWRKPKEITYILAPGFSSAILLCFCCCSLLCLLSIWVFLRWMFLPKITPRWSQDSLSWPQRTPKTAPKITTKYYFPRWN